MKVNEKIITKMLEKLKTSNDSIAVLKLKLFEKCDISPSTFWRRQSKQRWKKTAVETLARKLSEMTGQNVTAEDLL